jgi:hypothetical protein
MIVEEGGVPIATLLDAIRLSAHDVETLADLPEGYLSGGDDRVIDLPQPRLKRTGGEGDSARGEVVPFRRPIEG